MGAVDAVDPAVGLDAVSAEPDRRLVPDAGGSAPAGDGATLHQVQPLLTRPRLTRPRLSRPTRLRLSRLPLPRLRLPRLRLQGRVQGVAVEMLELLLPGAVGFQANIAEVDIEARGAAQRRIEQGVRLLAADVEVETRRHRGPGRVAGLRHAQGEAGRGRQMQRIDRPPPARQRADVGADGVLPGGVGKRQDHVEMIILRRDAQALLCGAQMRAEQSCKPGLQIMLQRPGVVLVDRLCDGGSRQQQGEAKREGRTRHGRSSGLWQPKATAVRRM